jgi:hypothetical protein
MRRTFMLWGASVALALVLTGCASPVTIAQLLPLAHAVDHCPTEGLLLALRNPGDTFQIHTHPAIVRLVFARRKANIPSSIQRSYVVQLCRKERLILWQVMQ